MCRRERDSLMSFEDMDSVASSDVSKTTDRTACDLSCFMLYSDCYYSYLVDDNEWKTAEDNCSGRLTVLWSSCN